MLETRNQTTSRRNFFKHISAGAAGIALGSMYRPSDSFARMPVPGDSRVSLVPGTDQREAAYQSLKPF